MAKDKDPEDLRVFFKQFFNYNLINKDIYHRQHNAVHFEDAIRKLYVKARKLKCKCGEGQQTTGAGQMKTKICNTDNCELRKNGWECPDTCTGNCQNKPFTKANLTKRVFRILPIHQRGICVTCDKKILKGDFVIQIRGVVKLKMEVAGIHHPDIHPIDQTDYVLDSREYGSLAKFAQFSTDPNVEERTVIGATQAGQFLVAIRDILPGTPILIKRKEIKQEMEQGEYDVIQCPRRIAITHDANGIPNEVKIVDVMAQNQGCFRKCEIGASSGSTCDKSKLQQAGHSAKTSKGAEARTASSSRTNEKNTSRTNLSSPKTTFKPGTPSKTRKY